MKKKEKQKFDNAPELVSRRGLHATPRGRTARRYTDVVIGSGRPDAALLHSAIREWIVPVLVRDFLAEHPVGVPTAEANSNKGTTGTDGEEGAGSTRMNPNGH